MLGPRVNRHDQFLRSQKLRLPRLDFDFRYAFICRNKQLIHPVDPPLQNPAVLAPLPANNSHNLPGRLRPALPLCSLLQLVFFRGHVVDVLVAHTLVLQHDLAGTHPFLFFEQFHRHCIPIDGSIQSSPALDYNLNSQHHYLNSFFP
jgi:hypothetical protein